MMKLIELFGKSLLGLTAAFVLAFNVSCGGGGEEGGGDEAPPADPPAEAPAEGGGDAPAES